MKSHERVLRAVRFETPDRIPLAKGEDADIRHVGFQPACDFAPASRGADEWGCIWESRAAQLGDQGQVTSHPLRDWDAFRSYRFPDPWAPGRFEHTPAQIAACRAAGAFVCGNLGKGPLHLLSDLRGFEEFLVDLVEQPERTETLLDGIFDFMTGLLRQYARLGVDAVYLIDDQAMQSGPVFSMDIWRRRFKPRYQQLFGEAHERGMRVYLHACGDLRDHLVDLAEAGVDMLDNKQPSCWMDSAGARQVKGVLTFSSCIDIQTAIHTIAVSDIPAAVDRLVRTLGTPAGGFIGTCYHQADLQIPLEKTHAMLAAFRAFRW